MAIEVLFKTTVLIFLLSGGLALADFDQLGPAQDGETIAEINTNFGTIKARIFSSQPQIGLMTLNFTRLAEQGLFDQLPFHRIVENFVAQGGDIDGMGGCGGHSFLGPGTFIEPQFGEGLHHYHGALAWASDGRGIGSQFYIVTRLAGAPHLDGRFAVFGQVLEGFEVLSRLSSHPTPLFQCGGGSYPDFDAYIESITLHAVAPLSADINQNGCVDGPDLSLLIGAWGQCRQVLSADFNGDDCVNGLDLSLLVSQWAKCGGEVTADANADGCVDGVDMSLLVGSFGSCSEPLQGDINGDGCVRGEDLSLLVGQWGQCA